MFLKKSKVALLHFVFHKTYNKKMIKFMEYNYIYFPYLSVIMKHLDF